MEYAVYPFDFMRITQSHNDGNHVPHWKDVTNYSDKPWDEASKDGGRQYFIPQNDYVVEQVLIDSRSVRLRTLNKVLIPYKDEPVTLYVTLTHMKLETMKRLKVGQIVHKNEKLILEGDEGGAYGNHFHCTANIGKYYGLKYNNNKKWVWCYEKSLLPDEAFYIDPDFTSIINPKGYTFKEVPVGYRKGDSSEDVRKICDFLSNFVKGNYYGDYCEACVSVYKKKKGFKNTDGSFIDNETLEAMKKDGLNV